MTDFWLGLSHFNGRMIARNNELDRTHDSQMSYFALNARSVPPSNEAARHNGSKRLSAG
jgi:hypothetical protein